MMKTSFSTLACPDWSLSEILRAATAYGYDGIELRVICGELDLWNLPEFKPSSLAQTRTLIQDHGLIVPSVGSSASFDSPEALERERNFTSALRMAEVAAGVGAPSIRIFGDRIQAGSNRKETAARIAESLSRLAVTLRPDGVQVWLETHGDFATGDDVSEILIQVNSPEVGIIWDPANAFEQNGEAPCLPSHLSPHVRHVHVKDQQRDAQGKTRYVLTGEGEFPLRAMFASLTATGFNGFISFEWEKFWHPELAAPEIALPHFMKWWKKREASSA